MNQWEILIYNIKDDTEMFDVVNALAAAGVYDAGDPNIGPYLCWGKPRSVFVDPSGVGAAVEVLNRLGYQTDEDANQE